MLKIFLASHGKLASGMKSSLDILLGGSENITIFDAYLDDVTVQEVIEKYIEGINEDDQVLMLSDLFGGSVNQVMYTYLDRPNFKLISGVNLALLLELSVRDKPLTDSEISSIIEDSKNTMKLVNYEEENLDKEVDFFN
ncbi:hypothetical protein AAK882_08560 [Carnobacteriaceae bacterium 52-44]